MGTGVPGKAGGQCPSSEERRGGWKGLLQGANSMHALGRGPPGKARGRARPGHPVRLLRGLPLPLQPDLNRRPPPSGAQGWGTEEKEPAPRGQERVGASCLPSGTSALQSDRVQRLRGARPGSRDTHAAQVSGPLCQGAPAAPRLLPHVYLINFSSLKSNAAKRQPCS